MSETRTARLRRRLGPAAVIALLLCGALLMGGAPTEDGLLRQIKVDVFDQRWPAVLDGCEQLLRRFPDSPSSAQAAFYRARALSRMGGREKEAIAAFRGFVTGFPAESLLIEQAWSDIFSLACGRGDGRGPECVPTLTKGIENPSTYVRTLAAITAADVRDAALRRKALAVLKRAHTEQTDPDVRNEILIAILKIDPAQVPQPDTGEADSANAKPERARQPTLIRMTVFNKREGTFDLKVNVPVAFARMLIEALGESQRRELRRGAREQGIDIDDIFDAIQKSGAGRLLEVDSEDSLIEIWIE